MHIKNIFPTAIEYLDSQNKTADVVRIAKQLMDIRNDCSNLLPAWFGNCQITNLANGTLSISVPNQAMAARLRQKIPFLQNRLAVNGWAVDTIRVKVRLTPPALAEKQVPKKPLPPEACKSFSELYEYLRQNGSTPSPLCEALHRLISRHTAEKKSDQF